MKTRHAVIIYLIGMLIDIVGALLKILHVPGADEVLVIGTIIEVVGIILIIIKLLKHPRLKDFLDW